MTNIPFLGESSEQGESPGLELESEEDLYILALRSLDYDKQIIAEKIGVSRHTVRNHLNKLQDQVKDVDDLDEVTRVIHSTFDYYGLGLSEDGFSPDSLEEDLNSEQIEDAIGITDEYYREFKMKLQQSIKRYEKNHELYNKSEGVESEVAAMNATLEKEQIERYKSIIEKLLKRKNILEKHRLRGDIESFNEEMGELSLSLGKIPKNAIHLDEHPELEFESSETSIDTERGDSKKTDVEKKNINQSDDREDPGTESNR